MYIIIIILVLVRDNDCCALEMTSALQFGYGVSRILGHFVTWLLGGSRTSFVNRKLRSDRDKWHWKSLLFAGDYGK